MTALDSHFGDDFCLTLLTADPRLAAEGDAAGVNRVGVDLERLGKAERQAGKDARASEHTWDDLANIAVSVHRAELFVRLNPMHPGTAAEVETALSIGARVLMLPAFNTADEVSAFVAGVRGRARVSILLETAPAVVRLRDILAIRGIDEVMVGLNDLHLQLRASNHFEVMVSPLIDMIACEVRRRGLPLGIGGIARSDDTGLPIPPDLVYAQYPRLGATGAWIARSFLTNLPPGARLAESISAARNRLCHWALAAPETLECARQEIARSASRWASSALA